MTHYDITIGNDVARDVHCDIIMGHDIVFGTGLLIYYVLLYRIFVFRTHEISLHKNNSPASPDEDIPVTGCSYWSWALELVAVCPHRPHPCITG